MNERPEWYWSISVEWSDLVLRRESGWRESEDAARRECREAWRRFGGQQLDSMGFQTQQTLGDCVQEIERDGAVTVRWKWFKYGTVET